MKKNKDVLRFIVERYLEIQTDELEKIFVEEEVVQEYWEYINQLFLGPDSYLAESDIEVRGVAEQKSNLLDHHTRVKRIWNRYRETLIGFIYEFKEMKSRDPELYQRLIEDKSAPFYEFINLYKQNPEPPERFYNLTVSYKVTFNEGKPYFFKNTLKDVSAFILFLSELPLAMLDCCELKTCGKIIVKTRSDKRFCKGCASNNYLQEKWKSNNAEMRQKEKERNARRRTRMQ